MPGLSCGMWTLSCGMHVGSSFPARDWTPAPTLGARSLTHWTTTEVPVRFFNVYLSIYFWNKIWPLQVIIIITVVNLYWVIILREVRTVSPRWIFKNFYLFYFIYFWLLWFFVAVHGLSLIVANAGCSLLWGMGFSLGWLLLLWSTGSRCAGSVVVVHGLSCSVACGIFPGQGSNPCPLHWQVDSYPLHHQGSPLPDEFMWGLAGRSEAALKDTRHGVAAWHTASLGLRSGMSSAPWRLVPFCPEGYMHITEFRSSER